MRTDCVRDSRKTCLPNVSSLGFDLWEAERGNWIRFNDNDRLLHGRVIGGVTCEGKRYIEVCAVLGNFDNPTIRWIEPGCVVQCSPEPSKMVFDFLTGAWDDPKALIARIEYGFPHRNGIEN